MLRTTPSERGCRNPRIRAPGDAHPPGRAGRRRFLESCCALAALPLLPSCARELDIVATLAAQLHLPGSRLGRLARDSFPQPCDRHAARIRFVERFTDPAVAGLNPANVLARYRALVRADFEQGRVTILSGWVIAETERELFALGYDPA